MTLLRRTIVLSCLFVMSSAIGLRKRDTPLQTLTIPVTLHDATSKYSVPVNMSSSNPQPFSFALSTGTGYSIVAGSNCSDCQGVTSYDAASSSSVQQTSVSQGMSLLTGAASGNIVRENCTLQQTNGSAWAYPNQTIVVANQSDSIFSNGVSGIFGLGTNARDGKFSDSVIAGWLRRNPTHTSFQYGMALNGPTVSSSDGGVLHWILPDQTAYQGDIAWKSMSPYNSTAQVNADWFVPLDGWTYSSDQGVNISQRGYEMQAVVDPFFPQICFPQIHARTIYASIAGASIIQTSATANVWGVPCGTKMTLTVDFGSLLTTLDESVLVKQQGSQCYGAIEEWAASSATEYLLGSSFISTLYLIFNISNDTDAQLGFARRAHLSSSKLPTASIIGLVFGCVAFVITLAIVGYLFRRARKRRSAKVEESQRPMPFTTTGSTAISSRLDEATGLLGAVSPPVSPDFRSTYSVSPSISPPSSAPAHQTQQPSFQYAVHNLTASSRQSNGSTDGDSAPPPYGQNEQIVLEHRPLGLVAIGSPPSDRKRVLRKPGT